jgi:DNA-binding transcriptional MerR regulator
MQMQLLEAADAARILGVTPDTVRMHADKGNLVIAATTGRGVRLFERREVERFRESRERQASRRER